MLSQVHSMPQIQLYSSLTTLMSPQSLSNSENTQTLSMRIQISPQPVAINTLQGPSNNLSTPVRCDTSAMVSNRHLKDACQSRHADLVSVASSIGPPKSKQAIWIELAFYKNVGVIEQIPKVRTEGIGVRFCHAQEVCEETAFPSRCAEYCFGGGQEHRG